MKDRRHVVVRIDFSPMNAQRWLVLLACGHDTWVTSKRRPKFTKLECPTCEAQQKMSNDELHKSILRKDGEPVRRGNLVKQSVDK